MDKEKTVEKSRTHTFFKILIIVLLIVIAISSVINTFYLFSINTKLSLLPDFNLFDMQNSLQKIEDTLDIGILDIFKSK